MIFTGFFLLLGSLSTVNASMTNAGVCSGLVEFEQAVQNCMDKREQGSSDQCGIGMGLNVGVPEATGEILKTFLGDVVTSCEEKDLQCMLDKTDIWQKTEGCPSEGSLEPSTLEQIACGDIDIDEWSLSGAWELYSVTEELGEPPIYLLPDLYPCDPDGNSKDSS